MPTFKISVLKHQKRQDNKFPVSIRMTFKRSTSYLKTEFYVTEKQISRDFTIRDAKLREKLNDIIFRYEKIIVERLGNNINLYDATELKNYLLRNTIGGTTNEIDFVQFSETYIEKIKSQQHSRARRVRTSLSALVDYFGRDTIKIIEINSRMLSDFEAFLRQNRTVVRKNQFGNDVTVEKPGITSSIRDYMADIRMLFNQAVDKYNDEDKGELLITHNPFKKYVMPRIKDPKKRSLTPDMIGKILNMTDLSLPGTHGINRAELGRDVFALIFYFAGINTVDLYNATSLMDGRLTYNRSKTKDRRMDEALISLKVQPEAEVLIAKYRDKTGSRVFNFYQSYASFETFNANVNKGLKYVQSHLELTLPLTTYSARHSWATIGRNQCGISKDDIHQALNHADAKMKVTDKYIDVDWTIIDRANRTVIDYVNNI